MRNLKEQTFTTNRPCSKYHNTLCFPSKIVHNSIVFNFSWDLQSSENVFIGSLFKNVLNLLAL